MADPSEERCSPPADENIDQVTAEESWEPMSIFFIIIYRIRKL